MTYTKKKFSFEPRRFMCLLRSESIVMLFNIVFALHEIKKKKDLWFNFRVRKE